MCAAFFGTAMAPALTGSAKNRVSDVRLEYRLEVEIKVGDEPQRPEQIVRMRSVRARGAATSSPAASRMP